MTTAAERECPACWATMRHVRATGETTVCGGCESVYAVSDAGPARSDDDTSRAARDVEPRACLLALAIELPRLTGRAMQLEPERRPDDSEERAALLSRVVDPTRREARRERRMVLALRALRRCHELATAGAHVALAQLWCVYGVVAPLCDASGVPDFGPADRARRLEALALGAASRTLRQSWLAAAGTRRVVHDLSRRLPPRTRTVVDPETGAVIDTGEEYGCTPRVVHTITTGDDGISVRASAAAWGRELLAPLWPAGIAVPAAVAHDLAFGWAPLAQRRAWDGITTKVIRAGEIRAWSETRYAAAEAVWRDA